MANFVFTGWKGNVGSATSGVPDIAHNLLKAMLLTSAFSPNQDTQVRYEDISANEVSGVSYTTGGATISNVAWTKDASNHRYILTADPTNWTNSSITARYAVVYDNSTSAKYLISLFDFGQQYSSTSGTFQINWDSTNGLVSFS